MRWYFIPVIWVGYTLLVGLVAFSVTWLWWLWGMFIAALLFVLDRVLYIWWLKPYEQLSIQFQFWWRKRDWPAVWQLLLERGGEQTKLILRSLVFVLLWPLVAVFVLTSTGSTTGAGLVMGLGLGLSLSIMSDWRDVRQLRRWLCWQVKREMTEQEVRVVAGVFMCLFAMLTVMVLAR